MADEASVSHSPGGSSERRPPEIVLPAESGAQSG